MISNIFNVKPIYGEDEDVLVFWQKKIFKALFLILLILGIVPYFLSFHHAIKTSEWTSEWYRVIFFTFLYIWTCGVTFLERIPFRIRVWAGISGFYSLGIFSMLSIGLIGSTLLYFICFSVFAALFSDIKGTLSILIVNVLTLIVFGVIYFNDILHIGYAQDVLNPSDWIILMGTFTFLCAAVSIPLTILIKAVNISGRNFKHLEKKISQKKYQQLKEKLIQAEKFKALGILAGGVAHDLNNILSGIATYPEVLMMDEDLDPKIKQGLTIIKDSGQKASAVVSDLLTISRGAGAEMEIININSIIDRYTAALDFIKIQKNHPHVNIEILTEPELLNINGSYIHIEKTIMNLVLNAVEEVSDQDKGGKVLITTTNSYIDPSNPGYHNIVQGEYVILSVIDNGSGIDEKNLEKIFEPFFTKKEMGKSGTGLGLTVVWNAVKDHNGFINVTPSKNGTKFDLLFPATRKEMAEKPNPETLDEIKGQGQMILVVDDLKDQQRIAVSILENLGYQTQAVDNGFLAVEFIKDTPTDLVILDMIMPPSISGLETYRMIKKIHPGQKAIIASGYSESEDVIMAQNLGAGSFVKKPYTVLDMGIAIKEELEK
ncbi:MAG: response regulator [Desulfobacteraceae bacterium]|nr:response regulator [Desulfobacteraceae bacterium]